MKRSVAKFSIFQRFPTLDVAVNRPRGNSEAFSRVLSALILNLYLSYDVVSVDGLSSIRCSLFAFELGQLGKDIFYFAFA